MWTPFVSFAQSHDWFAHNYTIKETSNIIHPKSGFPRFLWTESQIFLRSDGIRKAVSGDLKNNKTSLLRSRDDLQSLIDNVKVRFVKGL